MYLSKEEKKLMEQINLLASSVDSINYGNITVKDALKKHREKPCELSNKNRKSIEELYSLLRERNKELYGSIEKELFASGSIDALIEYGIKVAGADLRRISKKVAEYKDPDKIIRFVRNALFADCNVLSSAMIETGNCEKIYEYASIVNLPKPYKDRVEAVILASNNIDIIYRYVTTVKGVSSVTFAYKLVELCSDLNNCDYVTRLHNIPNLELNLLRKIIFKNGSESLIAFYKTIDSECIVKGREPSSEAKSKVRHSNHKNSSRQKGPKRTRKQEPNIFNSPKIDSSNKVKDNNKEPEKDDIKLGTVLYSESVIQSEITFDGDVVTREGKHDDGKPVSSTEPSPYKKIKMPKLRRWNQRVAVRCK